MTGINQSRGKHIGKRKAKRTLWAQWSSLIISKLETPSRNRLRHNIGCHIPALGQCTQIRPPRVHRFIKMVNDYKRKSNWQSWEESSMKNAIKESWRNGPQEGFNSVPGTKDNSEEKTGNLSLLKILMEPQKEEKQKGTKSAKRVQAETEIEKKKNREERSENRQEISKKGKFSKNSDVKRSKTKEKDSSSDEDDAECLYCFGLYSESCKGWVKCPSRRLWACCACAGVEDEGAETVFLCENCED